MPRKHKGLSVAARNYFMQNVKSIEEMENFLITYKIINLNQEERENLSRQRVMECKQQSSLLKIQISRT